MQRYGKETVLNNVIPLIRLFRIQASLAMNLFIFIPLCILTGNYWVSFINTLPFMLMISGEIALNDYCDIKKDAINKPHRPLVSGKVSKREAILCIVLVLTISFVMAMVVYKDVLPRFCIFTFTMIILSAYNLPISLIAVIKTFVTATCTVMCLLFICTFEKPSISYYVFLISAFLFISGRELLMDIRDIEGDGKMGYRTIPVRFGERKTVILASVFLVTSGITSLVFTMTTYIFANCILLLISFLLEGFAVYSFLTNKDRSVKNKAVIALWGPMIIMLCMLVVTLRAGIK